VDWGVYDARSGELVTKSEYTQAFAKILASAMNFAFKEGLKGDIWSS
jgi:hypothetical protein